MLLKNICVYINKCTYMYTYVCARAHIHTHKEEKTKNSGV